VEKLKMDQKSKSCNILLKYALITATLASSVASNEIIVNKGIVLFLNSYKKLLIF
jgi:hypothetical protein